MNGIPKKSGMHPGPHSSILEYSLQSISGPGHRIVRLPNPCTTGGATLDFAKIARHPSGHCPHQATRQTNRVLAWDHERDRDPHRELPKLPGTFIQPATGTPDERPLPDARI
ncbi:hypothetical protein GHT06_015171 [Daphnia sinensis]|uniref:Uncharacterized protein n=1 Tax=Daphnia sinensis TaxID=1820382 RepID=A0AAD5PT12_9CRUS|nr:hypothetical protein GHT06_015171 [Daphnia sinensis]